MQNYPCQPLHSSYIVSFNDRTPSFLTECPGKVFPPTSVSKHIPPHLHTQESRKCDRSPGEIPRGREVEVTPAGSANEKKRKWSTRFLNRCCNRRPDRPPLLKMPLGVCRGSGLRTRLARSRARCQDSGNGDAREQGKLSKHNRDSPGRAEQGELPVRRA